MGTTKEDIRDWLDNAKEEGATHMIVVCDTFDHEDFPVNVMPGEDAREKSAKHSGKDMQRVMEVYALHLDWDKQLAEYRSFHYEYPSPPLPIPKKVERKIQALAKKRAANAKKMDRIERKLLCSIASIAKDDSNKS